MSAGPEQLILTVLGEFVLHRRRDPVGAGVFIDILGGFEVPEVTTRSTLRRMTQRGLLSNIRSGRQVGFSVTQRATVILDEADSRVRGGFPFAPIGSGWTLVSYSVPETRREVRHRLRQILTWQGFGLLRDGLWIAPGSVDVRQAISASIEALGEVSLASFRVADFEEIGVGGVFERAWDLGEVRSRHLDFLARWHDFSGGTDPVHDIVALGADWLEVLRADPRLPASVLPADWPSPRSAGRFRELYEDLHPRAQHEFDRAWPSASNL